MVKISFCPLAPQANYDQFSVLLTEAGGLKCIIGIHDCIEIPIIGSVETFVWGVWVSLKKENFFIRSFNCRNFNQQNLHTKWKPNKFRSQNIEFLDMLVRTKELLNRMPMSIYTKNR
jgi:hypothetical protein